MRSSPFPWLLVLLTLDCAAQEAKPAKPDRPTSRPTAPEPAAEPAAEPATATGDDAALALARKVRAFAGGSEGWAKVDNVVMTFAGRRRLFWDVRAGKVRIENIVKPGQRPGRGASWVPIVYDVAEHRVTRLGDAEGAAKLPGDPTELAKGIWINDFYWLFAPLKVMDAGVALSIDPRQEDDAAGVARLHLRFEKVGVTPNNEYVLHVETKTGKVVRWDYFADADAKPRSWEYAGYRDVGPLHLSLSRPAVGGGPGLELTDVAVNVEAPDGIWTASGSILPNVK